MTPEQWQAVRACFGGALKQPPEARGEWLVAATGSDAAVRLQVEKLLESDSHPDERLNDPSHHLGLKEALAPEPERSTIGRYRIISVLGEGRSGIVYRAREQDRDVALKVLKASVWSSASSLRFRTEIRALALLRHENIARIYEAGTLPEAAGAVRPYFSMELIEGLPIHRYADEQRLDVQDRLRLIVQLCDAVQSAHQRGVIHRDLKPANVLVERNSAGRSIVKVIDFGIARLLEGNDSLTQTGQALGTPGYMSPEQMSGDPRAIDTRSDVYAVGALLHHLLLGAPPGASGARPIASLPRDLGIVLARSIEIDPARRFASAAEFAAELARFLEHRPILTRAPGLMYVTAKFVRRRPALALSIGAVIVAFIASLVIFLMANRRIAESERQAIAAQRALLREVAGTLLNVVGGSKDEARILESLLPQFEGYVRRHPEDPSARDDLALLLGRLGDAQVAAGGNRSAVELWRRALLLRDRDPATLSADQRADLSIAIVRVGDELGAIGDREGMIGHYRRALDMDRASLKEDPSNHRFASNFLYSLGRASNIAIEEGDLAVADALAAEQLDLAREISMERPSFRSRLDLANACGWLAECRRKMLRFRSAAELTSEQIRLQTALLAEEPGNRGLRLGRNSAIMSLLGAPRSSYGLREDSLAEELSRDLARLTESDPTDRTLHEHRLAAAVGRAESSIECADPIRTLQLAADASALLEQSPDLDAALAESLRVRTLQHVAAALGMMGCFEQARAWGDASKEVALRSYTATKSRSSPLANVLRLIEEADVNDVSVEEAVSAAPRRGQWQLRLRLAGWILDQGDLQAANKFLSELSAEFCDECEEAREQISGLMLRRRPTN
ncbi:MAG: serine/threonine-protein kinase [Phycisphaerales bacterium]|nr:serine/threonine protein kinase [Planctomycetota bacterium]